VALEDHHSAYLAKAVAGLTPDGRARVEEILDELTEEAGARPPLVRFAALRRAEVESGQVDSVAVDDLTGPELDALGTGFTVIRDGEPLDDVADWANAVLALLEDDTRAH
jgi:hypothetical protein